MVPVAFVIVFCGLAFTGSGGASNETRSIEPDRAPTSLPKPAAHSAEARSQAPNGEIKSRDNRSPAPYGIEADHPTTLPSPPAEITGKDGAPMVLVPAGVFTMGSENGDDDEFPIHRVQLDAFYIDKFEVTNGRFGRFVDAIQSEPPWGFEDQTTPIVRAERPVRWVNWIEAIGYCFWAGKRLPTEAEWEKAARGTDGRAYPWGSDPPTPVHAVYGMKAVSEIGDRETGKSPYGVYDMAGNLYEWVMDWYDPNYYANFAYEVAVNPRGPSVGTAKVQRGGAYTNTAYRLRSSFRTKGDPLEQDPRVGFRCVQDVTPMH